MNLNFSGYICQNPLSSWREIAEYIIIVEHSQSKLFILSDVGGVIWKSASLWIHTEQVIQIIKNEYDIDSQSAHDDTLAFILELLDNYLLVTIPPYVPSGSHTSNNQCKLLSDAQEQNIIDIKDICTKHLVPIISILELTKDCNLRCKHCYNVSRPQREWGPYEIKNVMDDLVSLGCLDLILTGGEPCIFKDFREILWYARERRFCVTLKTNGTLIDNEIASLLKQTLVVEVHVSLYSTKREEHEAITGVPRSHAKTLRGIEYLLKNNVEVRLLCPLTKLNYLSVKEYKEFADSLGVPYSFDPLITARIDGSTQPIELRLDDEDWQQLLENGLLKEVIYPNTGNVNESFFRLESSKNTSSKEPICGAGNTMLAITAYGDILPCISLPIKVGNIFENNLVTIWNQSKLWELFRKQMTASSFVECNDCDFLEHCPRCPGIAFSDTGCITKAAPASCRAARFFTISRDT
jgi:AdoMet-dependent heme synthase